jgi:23S rRNA (uracil1939-C5)-methyltransferase
VAEAILEIESIAAGGDGVARADGLVVFVPRSAPGDRARVEYQQHGGFARGAIAQLLQASSERVESSCQHYVDDRCGGCQLQHLSYEGQLRAKQRIVVDAVTRIGRVAAPRVAMHRSPDQWRYRRKLTLELRRMNGGLVAGLHRLDDPGSIFMLRDCPITRDDVIRSWREILLHGELLPSAPRLRASVLVLEGRSHLSVQGGRAWHNAGRLGEACASLNSIWWQPQLRREARPSSPRHLVFAREDSSGEGAAFAQVNEKAAALMTDFVINAVRSFAPATIVDAYCGVGRTTIALALQGSQVVGIEGNPLAVRSIAGALPEGSMAVTALVEEVIDRYLPADVVLVNPPRSGLHERVARALAREGAVRAGVVYTSCNPATLARDLARMPGFSIRSVDCFDMFPQTAHVETVCVLQREDSSS